MKVVSYAKIPLFIDVKAAQAELLAAKGQWRAHLNTYHYTGSWQVLPLRSPGGKADNPVPDLIGESGYADTLYMERFPSVRQLTEALECPIMSVRFLNLKAGAVIKQHTDPQLAFEKGEARLHFPVFTNPEVEFYSEEKRIYLNEGECWYLNANLPHRVSNNGPSDRIHLVVDCKVNDWIHNLITSSGAIFYKKEVVDDNLLNMIKHLRWQNTEQSNKKADECEELVRRLTAENSSTT
jgi:quercetin dioxygenase-like cupin family protein